MTEWQSIISTAPTQNSYGSCVRSGRKPTEPTSQHYVEAGDTLQGIALKYGTTTEELRRLNKLYYTDSILLRKFLVVPDKKNKPEQNDKPLQKEVQTTSEECNPKGNHSPRRRVPEMNGKANLKDDSDDAQSFLQKLDMQISAGKKVACTIISDPIYEIPSMPNSSSSRLLRRRSSFERTTATTFSNSDKLLNNDDEDLFRL